MLRVVEDPYGDDRAGEDRGESKDSEDRSVHSGVILPVVWLV